MTDITQVKQTLTAAGLPAAQLDIFAKPVQQRSMQLQRDENVQKFSDIVGILETGVTGPDAYRIGFGGAKLGDLSGHPNISKRFKQTDGKTNVTTAAGKHQYLKGTWDELSKKTGVKDFTEASQEINFRQLLKDKGTLDMVANGDFQGAINKLGKTWASFPSSPYPQGKKTWDQTNAIIAQVTGQEQAMPSYSGRTKVQSPKSPAVSEQNILTAALAPSPEENMDMAARNEQDAQQRRNEFLAQAQTTEQADMQVTVDTRMKDIDQMFSNAFGFDKAFKQIDNLPTLYDDKLRKLIDLA